MAENNLSSTPNCEDRVDPSTLHFDDAGRRMLDSVSPLQGMTRCQTAELAGQVLAEAIISPLNVPGHTNSAVDGFAINGQDIPPQGEIRCLAVQGTSLAGHPCQEALQPGHAIRITTGAVMPEGADTSLMIEHVEEDEQAQQVRIDGRHQPGQNVRLAGEDIHAGQTVLESGRILTAADVGVIASLGIAEAAVRTPLRVSLLSTGDEVTPLGQPLPEGGVYDSNRHALTAALGRLPAVEIVENRTVNDDPAALKQVLAEAAARSDLILTTGGVSVGSADFTRPAMEEIGQIGFWKIALKPGRPLAFGHIDECTFVGLPGNPVASMVTFYMLVLPVIWKKLGAKPPLLPVFRATTAQGLRKKSGRTEIQRGQLVETETPGEWLVRTTGKQGSGMLTSMSKADVLILLEHDRDSIAAGEQVTVLPLSALG